MDSHLSLIYFKTEDYDNALLIDKTFQLFFITKPNGKGTGLGLSLSYGSITKEHDGSIKVANKEGNGSEFIIALPI